VGAEDRAYLSLLEEAATEQARISTSGQSGPGAASCRDPGRGERCHLTKGSEPPVLQRFGNFVPPFDARDGAPEGVGPSFSADQHGRVRHGLLDRELAFGPTVSLEPTIPGGSTAAPLRVAAGSPRRSRLRHRGSIRSAASHCGVVGSSRSMAGYPLPSCLCSSLDQIGRLPRILPMRRSS